MKMNARACDRCVIVISTDFSLKPCSAQQDTCLAEVSLSLVLSGDVSLPEMRPGRLSLCVRTLLAELHEGLFLSPLLLPPTTTQKSVLSAAGEEKGGVGEHCIP